MPKNIDVLKYEESLKSFLRAHPTFTDYDFEGTNFSILISLLATNAYNMAHYGSMVGNEAWVDTSELRQSLVSHATDLNYIPRSMISAQSVLEIEIFPEDSPLSIVLPKYYRFKTSDPTTGGTIYFITAQDYVTSRDENNRYIFRDVYVYQGDLTEEYFLTEGIITNDNGYTEYPFPYVISSEYIDINSLEVFVRTDPNNANTEREYKRAKTLIETTTESATFFIRGIYDNQYAIEFGDGTFGAALTNNSRITARFRNTLGSQIQGNYRFSPTNPISGYDNIIINQSTRVQGGYDRESIEEIRGNAPRHFQIQDRAITPSDYEGIIKSSYPGIQQVSVFGGEEIQQYGKIFIVLKPYGIIGTVSNRIKTQIIDLLKAKNIVPEPIILDPNYFYLGISGNVFYVSEEAKLTSNQIKTNIISNLVDLNDDGPNSIGNFNANIFQSLINDVIRQSDNSIAGSDISIDIRKRWMPQRNINETLMFTLDNPFYESRDGAHRSPSDYSVTSNPYTIFLNDRLINVVVRDDGIGNLYYYRIDDQGELQRTGPVIGSVNYEEGKINLISNVYDYNNYIEFTFRLRNKSVRIQHDNFVIIDGNNIDIQMLEKNE